MNRMGKRFGLAAAILVALVLLVRLTVKSRNDPVVRGKPLSEWMEMENKDSDEYRASVAEMDQRCVRWLIRELDWSSTSIRTKLDGLMFRILRQPVAPESRPDYRSAAMITLSMLGSRAEQAIPALRKNASVQGTGQGDWLTQSMAIAALVLLGADSLDTWADQILSPTNTNWQPYVFAAGVLQTNAAPVVPRLVHAYEATTDDRIKSRITTVLRLVRSNPALSVPVFRSSLSNDNRQIKLEALIGLRGFGPESKPAWDEVVALLSDSNRQIRSVATNALRAIDREAAQRLGNKLD